MSTPTIPKYFVCKWRGDVPEENDWAVVFEKNPIPSESEIERFEYSTEAFESASEHDIVFCYQTYLRAIVGICSITEKTFSDGGTRRLKVKPEKRFEPPFLVLDWIGADRDSRQIDAFSQNRLNTLYELSIKEATMLLKACGVDPTW